MNIMNYGQKIRELREEKDLRLYDIAKVIDIEPDAYGLYEREYTTIPLKHLNTICVYFNVSLDYIFNFTNVKQYNNIKAFSLDIAGTRLREFRKENKLTQNKLAEILNINRSLLSKYESGKNLISTSFLYDICKKYNISADYLLGKIDNPKYLKTSK